MSDKHWLWLPLLLGFMPGLVFAQATWEYSPYRVRIWLAVEDSPLLAPHMLDDVRDGIATGAWSLASYAWQTTLEPAPVALRGDVLWSLEKLTYAQLLNEQGKPPPVDKLFLLAIREQNFAYEVAVREWDLSTRQGSEVVRLPCSQTAALAEVALRALREAFRPLAKIEKVDGKTISARVKAGGLLLDDDSPLQLKQGDVLYPVIRRNQRNGEPLATGGITAPAWTYLTVEGREHTLLKATLHTGFVGAVPTKGGSRLERLALLVKRHHAATLVHILSRKEVPPTDRRTKPVSRPLVDYEIYAKLPGVEGSETLGLTDWRGRVEVPVGKHPFQILYVRNGSQFLARLPVVVGQHRELTIEVHDDDPRLQAETKIRSLQSRVMDAVARREILIARIRNALKRGKFEDANKLLGEFRLVPQRLQMQRELDDEQRRMVGLTGTTAKRVEKLFLEGQRLLNKFLDPEQANALAKEIAAAEKNPPPTENTEPPPENTEPPPTTVENNATPEVKPAPEEKPAP